MCNAIHDIEIFRKVSTDNLVDTYDGLQTPVEIGPTFACMVQYSPWRSQSDFTRSCLKHKVWGLVFRREPSLQEMIGANGNRTLVQSGSFPRRVKSFCGLLAEVFQKQQLHVFLKMVTSEKFTAVFSCVRNRNIALKKLNSMVDNICVREQKLNVNDCDLLFVFWTASRQITEGEILVDKKH